MEATPDTAIYVLCYMQAREEEASMVSMQFSRANFCDSFGMLERDVDRVLGVLVATGCIKRESPDHVKLTNAARNAAKAINHMKRLISKHL